MDVIPDAALDALRDLAARLRPTLVELQRVTLADDAANDALAEQWQTVATVQARISELPRVGAPSAAELLVHLRSDPLFRIAVPDDLDARPGDRVLVGDRAFEVYSSRHSDYEVEHYLDCLEVIDRGSG